uniref:Strictosidine synthase conserved region domain-containing protein n=1 Tax=Panagrolaimus sp. JU765 TaxID=591449 RepID=A0AC34PYH8_9BILA
MNFADRPELIGSLEPKNIFSDAELLLKDELFGPESVVVFENAIYVTDDSGLVKIVDGKKVKTVPICLKKCGRPLGLRHLKDDIFIIADGELGILSVEFESGKIEALLPSSTVIEGRTIHYANDLDFINNETIIFSVSTRWKTEQFTNGLLEFANDGRIFTLNIKTKEYKLISENLQFANGVQVHSDKESILIFFAATIQNYGLFLELDGNGQIIDSWHDPTGKIKMISQVTETSDAIYLGSYAHEFSAKIKK